MLRYLRWDFTGDDALEFQAGSRYAFVVGFETPGPERGFTLANRNTASVDAPPALGDSHDAYLGGWAVRREGDGTLPPFMYPSPVPPREAGLRKRLVGESMFESGEERFSLSPTTAGYPDVDTYRDYEFYLEASAEQEADGSGRRIPLLAPEGARFGELLNCTFDPSNDRESRTPLFRKIYGSLLPGGLLLFDVAAPARACPA